MVYTNWLTQKMAEEELKKVELLVQAIERLNNLDISATTAEGDFVDDQENTENQLSTRYLNLESDYLSFFTEVTTQNTTIPLIVVESNGQIVIDHNIKYKPERRDQVLQRKLQKMKKEVQPIRIELAEGNYQLLYYRESFLLRNLRYYPLIQLFVIIIFIIVSYFAFSATQKAEQNQVWVGMSKETAHQLGTPISSLMAWIELLKLKDVDDQIITEFEKDTQRLERITERFSKIGSKPELLHSNLIDVLSTTINYLKSRSSDKVIFETAFDSEKEIIVPLNEALFSWVIENLCKNAIDAMDNEGTISVQVGQENNHVVLDISDTGNGIPKSQYKTVFNPGYSTKKRGWGLGLSLAKRIIEIYHGGKIFVQSSEIGKGTKFRIILNSKTA